VPPSGGLAGRTHQTLRRTLTANPRKWNAKMDESQFKKLAFWQQRAKQIEEDFERHYEAIQEFGDDDNFDVWWPGSVLFIDRSKTQTFGEACGYEYSAQYWADREKFVAEHGRWI
jgi:hypothetical protein